MDKPLAEDSWIHDSDDSEHDTAFHCAAQRKLSLEGYSNYGNTCFAAAALQLVSAHHTVTVEQFQTWLKEFVGGLFADRQQHDAMELLTFLLDGPSGDDFRGVFENTLQCPELKCNSSHVVDESFLFWNLALPTEWLQTFEVIVSRETGAPVLVSVKVQRSGTVDDLICAVQKLFPSSDREMRLVDIHKHRIFSLLQGESILKDYAAVRVFYAYEYFPAKKVAKVAADEGDASSGPPPPPPGPPPPPPGPNVAILIEPRISVSAVHRFQEEFVGRPIVLNLDNQTRVTEIELKESVMNQIAHLVKSADISLFTLRWGNGTAMKCGRPKCSCKEGCELGSSENTLALHSKSTLIIDWHESAKSAFMGETLLMHESVATNRNEGEETITLESCIDSALKRTQLDEANMLACDSLVCQGTNRQFFIQQRIKTEPKKLLIQLNRFPRHSLADKIDIQVIYPRDFMNRSLCGVLCHLTARSGGSGGGHYICYSKRKDEWLKFNDAVVTTLDSTHVQTKNAYILMYE